MQIEDLEVFIEGTIYVSAEVSLETFMEYNSDVEDYIINNLDELDPQIQEAAHRLNVVCADEHNGLNYKLRESEKDKNTLAETVISLNGQVEELEKKITKLLFKIKILAMSKEGDEE